ncbi:MAG TPA: glycosyltransferase family 4 protein [Pyrinomonadaceae bacterium]
MRVLLASYVDDNRWSGMGKWSHCMAEGLARLGHQPTLWFADEFTFARRFGRFAVLLFPAALAIRLWRRRKHFDAVVIHEPSGFWYGMLRSVVRSLPPMVSMCHNVESKNYELLLDADRRALAVVPRGTRVKAPLIRLWQSDGAIRLADHVVCLSDVDRNYVINRLGRAPDKVTVMHNGVDAKFFHARAEKSFGHSVLFVGGWWDVKGRRVLPLLWSQVRERLPEARLTIVGSGRAGNEVVADFAERDRLSVNVIPRIGDESEMISQYAAHDVFLMPSLSEGSPLALLEAKAAGLPIAAARVGGVPDVIAHEEHGLLFDALDPSDGAKQVCRLLGDKITAQRLGRAAQEHVRQFTWAAATQTLATAIESVLEKADLRRGLSVPGKDDYESEACAGRVLSK